jgi:hypothetical protein
MVDSYCIQRGFARRYHAGREIVVFSGTLDNLKIDMTGVFLLSDTFS